MFISELLSSARVIHDFESMNRLPHYIESADQENDDELNESSLIHSLCNVLFYERKSRSDTDYQRESSNKQAFNLYD